MLNLVEAFDLGALEYLGPDPVHLLVQAKMMRFTTGTGSSPIPTSSRCRWSGCSRAPTPICAGG